MNSKYTFLLFFLITAVIACDFNPSNNDDIIARVGNHQLTRFEIKKLIKSEMTKNDSAIIVDRYINNWAKKKVLLDKAKLNLNDEESNFKRLIKEYEEGLLNNAYKQKLVSQYLDTIVTQSEIEDYYNHNKDNFILSNDILMMKYAVFPTNVSNKEDLITLMKSNDSIDLKKLENICYQFSYKFGLSDSTWIKLSEMRKRLPELNEISDENFLKSGNFIEKQDSINLYLTRVLNIRRKKEISPMQFVNHRIKNIILNKRKLKLLREMEEQMLVDAIKKGEFEIFK
jgi:hypothetical protein